MTATRHRHPHFIALLAVVFAVNQGNTGFAAESDCRAASDVALSEISAAINNGEPFTFEREVDGDGVADVVRLARSSGSQASSTEGTLTLSANGEVIGFSSYVSFSSMINIHIVPPGLVGSERAAARLLVEDALFDVICDEPEPSLSRLLSIYDAVVWLEGRPALPGNYAVYYPEAPLGLIPFIGAFSELGLDNGEPVAVWVEYLGGAHAPRDEDGLEDVILLGDGFASLAMTPRHRVLGTRHGIVAVDVATERYAWLYVFPGGHKLRWKSIEDAALDGSEVTITVRRRYLDARETATITVNLYDGSYGESWGEPIPDTTAQQRPPE